MNSIDQILFQHLLGSKQNLGYLDKTIQEKIFRICKKHHIPGLILKFNKFHEDNNNFDRKLQKLNENYLLRKMILKNDLKQIKDTFKENSLKFIVLKGMAYELSNLHQANERHFRDIDILVEEKDLPRAYQILRSLDYAYKQRFASDNVSYLGGNHHLPVLINKNKTLLELHHRVTKKSLYKKCFLTDYIFKNSHSIDGYEIPNNDSLLAHLIYHTFDHHRPDQSANALYDVFSIISKMNINYNYQSEILELLDQEENFQKIIKLKQEIYKRNKLDNELLIMIENIIGNIKSDKAYTKKISIFSKPKKSGDSKITIKLIKSKINSVKFKYQVKANSVKFILLLLLEVVNDLKRIRL